MDSSEHQHKAPWLTAVKLSIYFKNCHTLFARKFGFLFLSIKTHHALIVLADKKRYIKINENYYKLRDSTQEVLITLSCAIFSQLHSDLLEKIPSPSAIEIIYTKT